MVNTALTFETVGPVQSNKKAWLLSKALVDILSRKNRANQTQIYLPALAIQCLNAIIPPSKAWTKTFNKDL